MEENKTDSVASNGGFDKPKLILPGAIVLAALLISGTLLYTQGAFNGGTTTGQIGNTGDNNQKVTPPSVDDDPVLGNKNAPITIIEFSDFQCPYCRQFWRDTFPQLKKEYIDTGKVKFVYRDFPLGIHPAAIPSALAGECAQDQNKFWEIHDKIFQEQDKKGTGTVAYTAADLKKWAQEIGLGTEEFNSCLDSGKHKSEVEKDLADGSAAGVGGTPSFFINDTQLVGAQPYEKFKEVIDSLLK